MLQLKVPFRLPTSACTFTSFSRATSHHRHQHGTGVRGSQHTVRPPQIHFRTSLLNILISLDWPIAILFNLTVWMINALNIRQINWYWKLVLAASTLYYIAPKPAGYICARAAGQSGITPMTVTCHWGLKDVQKYKSSVMTALSERTNFQCYGSFSGAGTLLLQVVQMRSQFSAPPRALGHVAFSLFWHCTGTRQT